MQTHEASMMLDKLRLYGVSRRPRPTQAGLRPKARRKKATRVRVNSDPLLLTPRLYWGESTDGISFIM